MRALPTQRLVLLGLVSFSLLALDLLRPPAEQWSARLLLLSIDGYQATASKALGAAGARCRFEPTCSHYGEAVIRRHGTLRGSWLAVRRIARCGPWTPAGTVDPPP